MHARHMESAYVNKKIVRMYDCQKLLCIYLNYKNYKQLDRNEQTVNIIFFRRSHNTVLIWVDIKLPMISIGTLSILFVVSWLCGNLTIAPVNLWIFCIFLPPFPMILPIDTLGTLIVVFIWTSSLQEKLQTSNTPLPFRRKFFFPDFSVVFLFNCCILCFSFWMVAKNCSS